jgi:hypothetical protein
MYNEYDVYVLNNMVGVYIEIDIINDHHYGAFVPIDDVFDYDHYSYFHNVVYNCYQNLTPYPINKLFKKLYDKKV